MKSPPSSGARPGRSVEGRRVIQRNGRIIVAAPERRALDWFEAAAAPTARGVEFLARGLCSRAVTGSMMALPMVVAATTARGQAITPLVAPAIASDYRRDRNISVTEQEQLEPSFQAIGVRFGSIEAYPSIAVTTGATSNVYVNNAFKRSDAFYYVRPAVYVTTDWPLHKVSLTAAGTVQRYAHEKLRNQENYLVNGEGRLDIGPDAQVTGRLQYSQESESPYASDLASDVSVLSEYSRFNPSLTAVYKAGRVRITGKVEDIRFRFNSIVFANDTERDQRERNRSIDRGSVQAEYALTPSMAAFAQASYEVTSYPSLRSDGSPNRDSKAPSALIGVNFDLAGLMRGSVAAGYTKRNYDAPIYEDNGGLIMQAQAEFFVTPLTTVGVGVQRLIQDSNSSNSGAYSDSRVAVNVDHALLRNLILTIDATLVKQKLLDSGATSTRTLAEFNARYQTNRAITLEGNVRYGRGRTGKIVLGVPFDELSGQVTLRFRR